MLAIVKCDCKNEYQDLTYGKGNRVFNVMNDGKPIGTNTRPSARCTVCGKEKLI